MDLALWQRRWLVYPLIAWALVPAAGRFVGWHLWWLVIACLFASIAAVEVLLIPGLVALRDLGSQRVSLNLIAEGNSSHRWRVFPVVVASRLCIFGLLAAFLYGNSPFAEAAVRGVPRWLASTPLAGLWINTELHFRVEFPSWLQKEPVSILLEPGQTPQVEVDSYSLVGLDVVGVPQGQWSVASVLEVEDSLDSARWTMLADDESRFVLSIGGRGQWTRSLDSIYGQAKLPKDRSSRLRVAVVGPDYTREVLVQVAGVQAPHVVLTAVSDRQVDVGDPQAGRVDFSVTAKSYVPMTVVELLVRTQSGYRFSKTVAEFGGLTKLELEDVASTLNLQGIPFAAHDVLYVKARAGTVLSGLVGESEELSFEIRTRLALVQEITKRLQSVLKSLADESTGVAEARRNIAEQLAEARTLTRQLGHRSPVHRRVGEALESSKQMRIRKDQAAQTTQQKVEEALQALKREHNQQKAIDFFARLQNLRNSVGRVSPEELPALAGETGELARSALELKGQLSGLFQDPGMGLSAAEQTQVKTLLNQDRTSEALEKLIPELQAANKMNSEIAVGDAAGEAQENLLEAFRMIVAARRRAVETAKQELQEADEAFQRARSDTDPAKPVEEGQSHVSRVPRLGGEFDQVMQKVDKAARHARGVASSRQREAMAIPLDEAQDGIVDALVLLQEEEAQDKQMNQAQEDRERRSRQELVSAQGDLDASWRKAILDEIARFRDQGETADSPLVKYLESRLR